jgi:hypothetical protein
MYYVVLESSGTRHGTGIATVTVNYNRNENEIAIAIVDVVVPRAQCLSDAMLMLKQTPGSIAVSKFDDLSPPAPSASTSSSGQSSRHNSANNVRSVSIFVRRR